MILFMTFTYRHIFEDMTKYSKLQLQLMVTALRENQRIQGEIFLRLFGFSDATHQRVTDIFEDQGVEKVIQSFRALGYGDVQSSSDAPAEMELPLPVDSDEIDSLNEQVQMLATKLKASEEKFRKAKEQNEVLVEK